MQIFLKYFFCIYVVTLFILHVRANTVGLSNKTKRQLYREHLLPQRGGKIPDGAFQVDRLAANQLNKAGISIPDGVLLEHRRYESHHRGHRHDPDIERSVVRLKQTPDGRYTPIEGRYPVFEDEIHSTYVIRPPVATSDAVAFLGQRYQQLPQPAPVLPSYLPNTISPSLQIPSKLTKSKPFDQKNVLGRNNEHWSSNSFHYFDDSPWSTWNLPPTLFPELFEQTIGYDTAGNRGYIPDFPSLTQIPITKFRCDNSGRMYADAETKCQVFHLCHYNGNKESFLCPPGTRFDSLLRECSPWYKTECLGLSQYNVR